MKKRFSTPIVVLLILVFNIGRHAAQYAYFRRQYLRTNSGKFKDVLSLTEKYYVDEVDTQKLN